MNSINIEVFDRARTPLISIPYRLQSPKTNHPPIPSSIILIKNWTLIATPNIVHDSWKDKGRRTMEMKLPLSFPPVKIQRSISQRSILFNRRPCSPPLNRLYCTRTRTTTRPPSAWIVNTESDEKLRPHCHNPPPCTVAFQPPPTHPPAASTATLCRPLNQ